jgi:membrane-bound lytic murein transglycosylase A
MSSKVTFKPARFAELPGWRRDDHLAALKTFRRSCKRVIEDADASAGVAAKSAELLRVCRAAAALKNPTRVSAKAFFEQHFVPHRVIHKGDRGFLTGYYEPVLKGSRKPKGRFQTPIYRRPPDLENVVAETQRASKSDGLSHVRKTASGVEPYPTRAEIEQGALAGQGLELLYLEDPVDAFFMHVQGSGRIQLPDGTSVRLNYDGKNGHPYTSVGRYLVEKGYYEPGEVTLQVLRKWLRADVARGQKVMWRNASFIFFRELHGPDAAGPMGAQKVALTPGRSLAVDTAYHVLGSPVYVSAPALKHATKTGGFHRLMIAQDVGSAIKGPERGDIYFGSGDRAARLAGITQHPGSFFVLLPASAPSGGQARERAIWQKIEKAER